jgi:hypothetical protein
MTDLTTLKSIRDRVAQATGPDSYVDTCIHTLCIEMRLDAYEMDQHYPFTSSIDAALALAERLLPGWEDFTGFNPDHYFNGRRGCAYCCLSIGPEKVAVAAATRGLAIILATLDALIAKEKTDDQA